MTRREDDMAVGLLPATYRCLSVIAVVLCVGLFSVPRDVSAGRGRLDGKTFDVETGEKGMNTGEKDTLTFKDGRFRSAGCGQYGFGDGDYTSKVRGESITFESVITSPTKGKMIWKGVVTGDRIEAIYTWVDTSHWYDPDPKPVEKWAKGDLRK